MDLFQPFSPCRLVWPCGQYIGTTTTGRYVCLQCWNRMRAVAEATREMLDNYAGAVADAYGPEGVP